MKTIFLPEELGTWQPAPDLRHDFAILSLLPPPVHDLFHLALVSQGAQHWMKERRAIWSSPVRRHPRLKTVLPLPGLCLDHS